MARRPKVLIVQATGSNRDREAAQACTLAGGDPHLVLMTQLLQGHVALADYQMLVLPGGFSYGDDLGAGKLWALRLRSGLGDALARFVESGRPVLGICNGFQALVKSGLLPGPLKGDESGVFGPARVTLTRNASAKFECRWVHLAAVPGNNCVFTRDLGERLIHCPVAHGEGRLISRDAATLTALETAGVVALRYVSANGRALDEANPVRSSGYPHNPNGSQHHIAGISNVAGNVLGLMPHPENHLVSQQHPTRATHGELGLVLFEAGIRYAAAL